MIFAVRAVVASTLLAFFLLPGISKAADPAAYGALPRIQDPQISPDGKTIAYLRNDETGNVVVFTQIGTDAPPSGINLGDVKARGLIWASNDHVILLTSYVETLNTIAGIKTYELRRWVSVPKDGGEPVFLFRGSREFSSFISGGRFVHMLPDEPEHILMAQYEYGNTGRGGIGGQSFRLERNKEATYEFNIYRLSLKTGKERRVALGNDDTYDWVIDRNGVPAYRADLDKTNAQMKIYRRAENADRYVSVATLPLASDNIPTFNMAVLGENRDHVVGTRYGSSGTLEIAVFDTASGEFLPKPLFSDSQYDIDSLWSDNMTAAPLKVTYYDDFERTAFFDPLLKERQNALSAALPDAVVSIVSYSQDRSRLLLKASYSDFPGEYMLYDHGTKSITRIGNQYPDITSAVYARTEPYSYTASDGLKIPGYLTLPAGSDRSRLGLIVLPHGGPEGRDDQAFDWWAHFYAAKGYAVYQPNFRGSFGYGRAFKAAGFGEWGRRMQADITEGVQSLINKGIADSSRICIVGASYGGYAALAGATLTPDLYQCAISANGVSDLPAMLGYEGGTSELAEDYWTSRIGSRFRDTEALNAVSPAMQARAVSAPIQLIVSKEDTVVPAMQSSAMRTALENAGKPHEYILLDGEDHWMSRAPTRIRMLSETIRFIDTHIGQ